MLLGMSVKEEINIVLRFQVGGEAFFRWGASVTVSPRTCKELAIENQEGHFRHRQQPPGGEGLVFIGIERRPVCCMGKGEGGIP